MFLITQFIGLYVVSEYTPTISVNGELYNTSSQQIPYGMAPPALNSEKDFLGIFFEIILAFVISISLIFLLIKLDVSIFMRIWFLIVIIISLSLSFNVLLGFSPYSSWIALAIALPLALWKVFGKNFLVHNITELLIYPGIAAVFVQILNFYTVFVLLILISIYDMWAVWHSGIMQKMAKYQMDKVKIFGGFFVPYLTKNIRDKIKNLSKAQLAKKKLKVHVAILGGGDIVFPIITAGVVLKTAQVFLPFTKVGIFQGGVMPAVFVIFGALLGLGYLMLIGEKKKFYPAMPFITVGIIIGMVLSQLVLYLF